LNLLRAGFRRSWLLAPAILYYRLVILAAVAWLVPAVVANERMNGKSYHWYFVIAVIWGAWLCSPIFSRVCARDLLARLVLWLDLFKRSRGIIEHSQLEAF
jgi:hypothetical protein